MKRAPKRKQITSALLDNGLAWQGFVGAQHGEMKKAFLRAYELCQKLDDTSHLGQVLGGLSVVYYVRAEYQKALELAEETLLHTSQTGDPLHIALANWYPGILMFCLGEITTAHEHFEKLIKFYRPKEHHYPFIFLRGSDAGLGALAYSACSLWCLGFPDQAMKRSQEMLPLADVICFAGCFHYALCRNAEALFDNANLLIRLAESKRLSG